MEVTDQLVNELNFIAGRVDNLKDVPRAILGIADSIDNKDYQAAQDVIIQLHQVQRTINMVFAILHPVRQAATDQRVILERVIGSKRVGPS